MAITGAIFNSLIYGGVDSADYGVYITGDAVFNAPKRSVELVSVPGRNGSIEIDQGHFENIEVSYPAGMFGDDKTDFRERLSDFRNAIMAQKGYQRLSDTYHPDEYRMGIYVDGLEVDPKHYNEAGQFMLKFNCKPQRWLTSGEEPIDVMEWGETETLSGEIVTFEVEDETIGIKSVTADITPIQDLHGYDKPWAGGNGKNKLPMTATSRTVDGITFTVNGDGTISTSGIATANTGLQLFIGTNNTFDIPNGKYILTGCPSGGGGSTYRMYVDNRTSDGTSSINSSNDTGSGASITITQGKCRVYIYVVNGQNMNGKVFKPMLRLASETDASFEPYSNICPISGWDDETIYVSPTEDEEDATTYIIDLDGTRYGGTLDVTSGVMVVDRAEVDLGTLSWALETGAPGTNVFLTASLRGIAKPPADSSTAPNIICSNYSTSTTGPVYRGEVTAITLSTGTALRVRDTHYASASDFTTAMSGVQLVYELATPLTVQLTPQQIEALLGTNNVWASTGDVTVEYGAKPGYVTNPTLFDAQPLLYAEGSGKIEFNGYEVEIADVVLGDVTLWERGSEKTTFGGQLYSRTIAPGLLNIGDNFTLDSLRCSYSDSYESYSVTFSNASATVTNSGIPGVTGSGRATISSNGHQVYWTWNVVVPPIEFVFGTAKTVDETSALTANWSENGTAHTLTHNVTLSISYDGDSTVTITFGGVTFWMTTTLPACTGVSTVSLGGYNMYIDCDLGEAYYIEGGEIVSLNAYIDLGSDLPVLAPGINHVTYDESIDVLNVTPRWWKV